MSKVFITHRVKDYAAWKHEYDADAANMQALGFNDSGHFHTAADPNHFLITWDSELDLEEAKARVTKLFSDPDFLGFIERQGVFVDEIEFWVAGD